MTVWTPSPLLQVKVLGLLDMAGRAAFALFVLALASAGPAQSPFTHRDGSEDGDAILPITSYPLGQAQAVASSMARNLRWQWIEREVCDQVGCLVIQNDSKNYRVAEFRIQVFGHDGSSRWSRNQLLHPLLPKQKLVRMKVAPVDSCDRDILFVLQHRKTKEKLVMESSANLCPTPNADNLIRLDVKKPQVTVEDEIQ